MRKRSFALALTVALVVGLLPLSAAPAMAYTIGAEFPVSLANSGQVQPDIDYPWIVWKDERSDEEIYAYNFVTETEQLVASSIDENSNPSVSGDWVVYSQRTGSYCSVFAKNLVTDETVLIADGPTDSISYGNPAIDGSLVVFNAWGSYGDVYMADIDTPGAGIWPVSDTTDDCDQYSAEIGDGWITYTSETWDSEHSDWLYSIVVYEIGTGVETVIEQAWYTSGTEYADFYDPATDGGYVTYYAYGRWSGDGNQDEAIMLYDLSQMGSSDYESVRIDSGGDFGRRRHPVIADGLISYHDDRKDDGYSWYPDVYVYNIRTGVESCVLEASGFETSDVMYGGRTAVGDGIVAWHDHRDEGINSDGTSYDDLYAVVLSEPPTPTDDLYTVKQNALLSVPAASGLLANDTDPNDDALVAVLGDGPYFGSAEVNADGSFLYAPNTGFFGTDAFTYECWDGYSYVTATVWITVEQSTAISEGTGAVYRFYNPVSGSHFYTPSIEERNYVLSKYLGTWFYEGFAFTALPASGTAGIHRFYNARTGAHFYTPFDDEKASVLAKWPTIFSYEGQSFPVTTTPGAGTTAIYRFYNTKTGAHFYTASAAEADHVIATYPGLFNFEGVGFYVVSSL